MKLAMPDPDIALCDDIPEFYRVVTRSVRGSGALHENPGPLHGLAE